MIAEKKMALPPIFESQEGIHLTAYLVMVRCPVADTFAETDVLMETTSKKSFEKALLEFRVAKEMNVAEKNIFHIAKAAVQGRVKKLIVADGVQVYGRIDRNTGSLSIHPFDLDHEDDDILDDIAQTVLAAGGEVVVAPREEEAL